MFLYFGFFSPPNTEIGKIILYIVIFGAIRGETIYVRLNSYIKTNVTFSFYTIEWKCFYNLKELLQMLDIAQNWTRKVTIL